MQKSDKWQRWLPGEKKKLVKDYAAGADINNLAKRYRRSKKNIRAVLHMMNAPKRQERITDCEKEKLIKCVDKGLTDPEISELLGKCRSTIQRYRLAMMGRKNKSSCIGADGWPVGLTTQAISVLDCLVETLPLTRNQIFVRVSFKSLQSLVATIRRLIEKRLIRKFDRVKSAPLYYPADRVVNMRRDFAKVVEK